MKTICPPGYDHSGILATHVHGAHDALGRMMLWISYYHLYIIYIIYIYKYIFTKMVQ